MIIYIYTYDNIYIYTWLDGFIKQHQNGEAHLVLCTMYKFRVTFCVPVIGLIFHVPALSSILICLWFPIRFSFPILDDDFS